MLSKLIKNEFRFTGHYLGIVYIVTAIAVGISAISVYTKSPLAAALSSLLIMGIAFAFTLVTTIVIFVNFNKSLYGDSGYLTFTLPVKTRDLLFSKFFVGFVWFLCSYAVTIVLTIWSMIMIAKFAEQGISDSASGEQFAALLELFKALLNLPNKGSIIAFVGIAVLMIFAVCLLVISVLFMSISIGNTRPFQKHNVIWSLVFTGASAWICSQATKAGELLPINANLTNDGIQFLVNKDSDPFYLLGAPMILDINIMRIIVIAVLIVVMCVITSYIMKHKVNIK